MADFVVDLAKVKTKAMKDAEAQAHLDAVADADHKKLLMTDMLREHADKVFANPKAAAKLKAAAGRIQAK